MNDSLLAKTHRMYTQLLESQTQELAEVQREYAEFKEKNSLDAYFTKNLNNETKKRLLDQIEDLKKETDWGYYDPSDLDSLQPSEPEKYLEVILKEQEYLDQKRANEIHAAQLEAQAKAGDPESIPMPAKIFADSFNETLHRKVIGKAIDQTGEVATSFWLGHFGRRAKHQSTQTLSIEELLAEAFARANAYKRELDVTAQRLASNTEEMGKIARKLTDMSAEKQKYQKQVAALTEEMQKLSQKYGASDVTIQKLHRDLNAYKAELVVLRQRANDYAQTCEVKVAQERKLNALV